MSSEIKNLNVNKMISPAFSKKQVPFTSENKNTTILSTQNTQNQDYNNNIASYKISELDKKSTVPWIATISGSLLLISGIALFITKGGKGNFRKKLNEFTKSLNSKSHKKPFDYKNSGFFDKIKFNFKKIASNVSKFFNIIPNFNSIKDSLFDKILRKNKTGTNFIEGSKKIFRNLSIKTVDKSYSKANSNFDDIIQQINELAQKNNLNKNIKIGKTQKSVKEWLEIVNQKINTSKNILQTDFDKTARLERINYIDKSIEGLNKKVYQNIFIENRNLLKKETWINYQDYITERFSKSAKEKLQKELSGKNQKIFADLTQKNVKKGELDEALNILKNITDEKSFKKINKKFVKFSKNLNKAITLEGTTQFEKFAEYEVGSQATDIICGAILPTILAGLLIAKEKNKEDKIETTLNKGIPIIGGLAMVFYGTSRMFSGAKNIIIGIATTFGLNLFGNLVNKIRKSYNEKRSLSQVALEAYKKNNLLN